MFKKRKYRFLDGMRVNDEKIFIFGWTNTLQKKENKYLLYGMANSFIQIFDR